MSDRRAGLDREAMRDLVRQVLRDVLPEAIRANASLRATTGGPADAARAARPPAAKPRAEASPRPAPAEHRTMIEEVALYTDRDLAQFVRRLARLLDHPADREAVQAGRHQFRLKRVRPAACSPDLGAPSDPARPIGAVERIAQGVVKESMVVAAAKAGARLVLGKKVVVTPLARDKARQLGVRIERDG